MQKQVYIDSALGLAGTISRLNPVPQHLPFLAEGDAVKAGGFVFAGTDAEKQVKGIGSASEAPVGLCIFENMQPALGAANGLTVMEGEEVAVLLKGCAYITAPATATKGMKVNVKPTTGEIEVTSSSASEGFVDTGFVVLTGAASGYPCEIMKL